jgi:hypothetical protein
MYHASPQNLVLIRILSNRIKDSAQVIQSDDPRSTQFLPNEIAQDYPHSEIAHVTKEFAVTSVINSRRQELRALSTDALMQFRRIGRSLAKFLR